MLSDAMLQQFDTSGFVVVENFVDSATVTLLRARFEKLFRGEFETGIQPDEWNWRTGRDSESLTRQICNAWKSDNAIAATVLRRDIGEICAQLRLWPGARINQDNVIWKPPGAAALGFHQDESYQSWIVPGEMITCWITLDDTSAQQGTIEYARGSHLWPLAEPIEQFHAPADPLAGLTQAAKRKDREIELVAIEVPAGTAVFHHGRIWHGSRANTGAGMRRSVVTHCMSSEAVFHAENKSPVYSRYQSRSGNAMDESFFPVLWHSSGYRSSFLEP